MKRKVIKQGNGTLTITLPKGWTNNIGLKGGDEIEIAENEDSLIIGVSKKENKILKTKVDLRSKSEKFVKYTLSILHKQGYDEIEIFHNHPKWITLIENHINDKLSGFEIIEQSNKRFLIKRISTVLPEEFEPILRKAFLVTKLMGETSLDAFHRGAINELDGVLVLEKTNDKLTNLCQRILIKERHKNQKKTDFIYTLVWQLEKVADSYSHLCKEYQNKKNIKINKKLLETYKETNILFSLVYETYYKSDNQKINEILKLFKDIKKSCFELIKSGKPEERIFSHYLLEISEKAKDMLGPILGCQL